MHQEAGVLFHMYSPSEFVRWAGRNLKQEISEEAADEIEGLRPLEETGADSSEEPQPTGGEKQIGWTEILEWLGRVSSSPVKADVQKLQPIGGEKQFGWTEFVELISRLPVATDVPVQQQTGGETQRRPLDGTKEDPERGYESEDDA